MIRNLKAIGLGLASAILSTVLLVGCAGSDAGVAGVGGAPCTTVTGGQLAIAYPERSRIFLPTDVQAGITTTNLSSALSAKIVIAGAAPDGTDLVININRDPNNITAHTETYNVPTIKTGTFNVTATVYAQPDQTGAVVGNATVVETISCVAAQPLTFTFTDVIASVDVNAVNPAINVGDLPRQLTFTAKDGKGAVVPVSPGSAIFSILPLVGTAQPAAGATTITKDGILSPNTAGSYQVHAVVDGVASPPLIVTIQNVL